MSDAVRDADRSVAHSIALLYCQGQEIALHSALCDAIAQSIADARKAESAEIARLKDLLHRDNTGLAFGLNKIQRIAKGFDWICEGRGPYEYDDDRYRMEVGSLIAQVLAVADEHLRASGDLANEAFHPRARETARMLTEDCAARWTP